MKRCQAQVALTRQVQNCLFCRSDRIDSLADSACEPIYDLQSALGYNLAQDFIKLLWLRRLGRYPSSSKVWA